MIESVNADTTSFFYAKIGPANAYAETYLRGNGEIDVPAIPIYFDCDLDNERSFLESNCAKEQGKYFFECGRSPEGKFIVVVYAGEVWILAPSGPVQFARSTVGYRDNAGFVKLLPIQIEKRISLAEVPHVLASIGANRYYSSGTFRKITGIGNILAIKSLLGMAMDVPPDLTVLDAVSCLSSVEFETLIAKILEEQDLFVPAYRGGVMAGADLFAYNKSQRAISVGGLCLQPGRRLSIQVKLRTDSLLPPSGIDLLICGEKVEGPKRLGMGWLGAAIKSSRKSREWLRSSLDWLPSDFLSATCG